MNRLGVNQAGLGFNRGGGAGYTDEAIAYFAAMATQLSDTRKSIINKRIVALKACGAWDKMACLYFFDLPLEAQALLNVKSPGVFTCTNNGAMVYDTSTFTGFTGGAGKYLNTNFNPCIHLDNMVNIDSISLGAWVIPSGVDNTYYVGAYGGGVGAIGIRRETGKLYPTIFMGGLSGTTVQNLTLNGLIVASRVQGSDNIICYQNETAGVPTGICPKSSIPSFAIQFSNLAGGNAPNLGNIKHGFIGSNLIAQEILGIYAALSSNGMV